MSRHDVFVATAAGVTLAAASFTLGAGAMHVYHHLGQSQGLNQGQGDIICKDSCLASCTCSPPDRRQEPHQKRCEKHDQKLIMGISKLISRSDVMFEMGISLDIQHTVIEASIEDNKGSIKRAAQSMLFEWYKEQDGLRAGSEGIEKLKQALKNCGLESDGSRVIERHFEDR